MQGLGEGPDRVLAGMLPGTVCLLEKEGGPKGWVMERQGNKNRRLRCMAAADEVIVTCDYDGTLHIMRMTTPLTPSLPEKQPDAERRRKEPSEPNSPVCETKRPRLSGLRGG